MDQNLLNASGSGGSQTNTQNPQTVGGGLTPASANIQAINSTSALTNSTGLQLHPAALTTATLNTSNLNATTKSSSNISTADHKVSVGLLALPILLIIAAAMSFWFIRKSANNTTD